MSLASKGKSRQLSAEPGNQQHHGMVLRLNRLNNNETSEEETFQDSVDNFQDGVDDALFVRRPRGDTKVDAEGSLYWRGSITEAWRRAIYHVDIRDELIEVAEQQGQYAYPRAMGVQDNDVTSYLPEHRMYGAQRNRRPDLLFQYKLMKEQISNYIAPIWIYKDRVVLDPEDHPVLDWPEVPATFSSKIEGWLQEFISRKYFQFALKDFVARMIPGPINHGTICMRRTRFRLKAGCLSWKTRQGNEDGEVFLDSLLPESCKLANSTKAFRDLSGPEMRQLQLAARGYREKQAKRRTLTRTQRRNAGSVKRTTSTENQTVKSESDTEIEQLSGNENLLNQESVNQDLASQVPQFQEQPTQELPNEGLVSQHQETNEGSIRTATESNVPELSYVDNPDYTDYRYVFPNNVFDQITITQALEPTRKQFWRLTGMNAQTTETRNDYASQWGALQLEFDAFWQISRSTGPNIDLVMAEEWLGGFERLPIVQVQEDEMTFPEFQIAREYYIPYFTETFQELR